MLLFTIATFYPPGETDILAYLDELIQEGTWGTKGTMKKVRAKVVAPLRRRIQREKTSREVAKQHIKALNSLARNPVHLRDFSELVVKGGYHNTTFTVSGPRLLFGVH